MKKLILALVLILAALSMIIIGGDSYSARFSYMAVGQDVWDYDVVLIQDDEVVKINDTSLDGNDVIVDLESVSRGTASIEVYWNGGSDMSIRHFYVHRFGLITADNFFGDCTNGHVIMLFFDLYLVFVILELIRKYRRHVRVDFYNYRNVTYLAIIFFLSALLINCLLYSFTAGGLVDSLSRIMTTTDMISLVLLPLSFVFFFLIGVNNLRLTIKEGVSKANVMGVIFCFFLCFSLVFPKLFDYYLQIQQVIDVHREFGPGHFFNEIAVNIISVGISYLACVLIAMAIMAGKSLRQTQHYNRNYVIILGCQIRKDGTLTPLLKGRVDAAIDFAKRQQETTGLEPVFVPSGGKGSDEVMAEAEAMRNYLVSCGISEDRIIVEDKSTDTYENFKFSMEKIREHAGDKKIRVVFATTNYHVLRAGFQAAKLGINARGIGSRTKFYFSSNAFIRECLAMLYYERKVHIKMMIALFMAVLLSIGFVFLANMG